MQMLTKFESKSNRVKGLAFHPRRPWILASLHNGSIQLWDFRMGTLLEKFDEHDGPVRGIAFHPTQPLFASGGDDYKVRVWSYKDRRCLFTLTGHLDYVRTVAFHPEEPWILTASDDQTMRIWNWQSRQCVTTITGHSHYVMSAAFHPTQDLIVSASMDQTVRVWDMSGLRKAAAASAGNSGGPSSTGPPTSVEELVQRATAAAAGAAGLDESSSSSSSSGGIGGVVVKFVLEGHDRGVDWASFHPTQPLIVSGGDDRQVRVWRLGGTRAWEAECLRGHFNNVSSVLFHPRHPDMVLSASEDRTLRVWDVSKKGAIQTFRRENERFWMLAAHPSLPLFAAGHDGGLLIFKLDRERPAMSPLYPSLTVGKSNALLYVRDREVRYVDVASGEDALVMTLRRGQGEYAQVRSMSYQPQERAVLVCHGSTNPAPSSGSEGSSSTSASATEGAEEGTYGLYVLGKKTKGGDAEVEPLVGKGSAAAFVGRQRFVVLDRSAQSLTLRDLTNAVTRTLTQPGGTEFPGVNGLFPLPPALAGGEGGPYILLSTPTHLILYGLGSRRVEGSLPIPGVRYVIWEGTGTVPRAIILTKHTLSLISLAPTPGAGEEEGGEGAVAAAASDSPAKEEGSRLTLDHQIHETIRLKSATWASSLPPLQGSGKAGPEGKALSDAIVVYSTLNHIKFALGNGDTGVIRTLEEPIYLTHASPTHVSWLARVGGPSPTGRMEIAGAEMLFKRAILAGDYPSVERIMSTPGGRGLVGQAVIGWVQKAGHPEVALRFVRDAGTRLALALECGDVGVAAEAARKVSGQGAWARVGETSMALAQAREGELAWQRSRHLPRLSLLYALAGERGRMRKMGGIYGAGADGLVTSMWTGDVEGRVDMLLELGQAPLAYLLAKSNGLDARATDILAQSRVPAERVILPQVTPSLLQPPIPVAGSNISNWPLKRLVSEGFGNMDPSSMVEDSAAAALAAAASGTSASSGPDALRAEGEEGEGDGWGDDSASDLSEGEEAWGVDEVVIEGIVDVSIKDSEDTLGPSYQDRWTSESPLAVDHVAAGSIDTALQLLHRQVGIAHFAPLRPLILSIAQSATATVGGALEGTLGPLQVPLHRGDTHLPYAGHLYSLSALRAPGGPCLTASHLTTRGKFQEAVSTYTSILHALLFARLDPGVTDPVEVEAHDAEVHALIAQALSYTLGLRMEQARRSLATDDPADAPRSLALAAYFTHQSDLAPSHLQLALNSAMKAHYKAGNYLLASGFARRLLDLEGLTPSVASQARQIKIKSDQEGVDAIPIDYDPHTPFTVCAAAYTPISLPPAPGTTLSCPYCRALYDVAQTPGLRGEACRVCLVGGIGLTGSGLTTHF